MATDLEQMTATFDADISRFERKMDAMGVSFDRQIAKIDSKQGAILKRMNSGWNALSFGGLENAWKKVEGLFLAGGVTAGIVEVVKSSLEAAAGVSKIAEQAGVSTNKLQEMRYAVSQTGGDATDADQALIAFNKNFGIFLDSGGGRAAQSFKTLGIDKLIDTGQVRTAEQALDAVLAKIETYSNASERSGFAAKLFGQEAGPKLAGLLNLGSAGIAALEQRAHDLGLVLSDETVESARRADEKLSELFSTMKAQGVAALANLAPEIANVASQITASLPSLAAWVEHWADFFGLLHASPLAKAQYAFDSAKSDLTKAQSTKDSQSVHWPGWDAQFDLEIADAKQRMEAARAQIQNIEVAPVQITARRTNADLAGYEANHPAALHVNDVAGAKHAADLDQNRKEVLAGLGADAATANAALVAAQNNLAVQLLKGTGEYYTAVKKEIADDLAAKIAAIDAEENKKLTSLAKLKLANDESYRADIGAASDAKRKTAEAEAAEKSDNAGLGSVTREGLAAGDSQIRNYQAQIQAIGQLVGESARYAFYQSLINAAAEKGIELTMRQIELTPALKEKGDEIAAAATATQTSTAQYEKSAQVTDELRTGLESMAETGLRGFSGLNDAAQQFLEQLAQMILKLYVMQPLLDSLLGKQGTSGGGLLGSGLSSLLGSGGSSPSMLSANGASLNGAQFADVPSGLSSAGTSSFVSDALSWIGSLFADGGIFVPGSGRQPLKRYAGGGISNTAAIFGEAGPEAAIPLKDGMVPVSLRMPAVPKAMAAQSHTIINAPVTVHQSLEGAIGADGIASIAGKQAQAMGDALVKHIKSNFPAMMDDAMKTHF